LIEVMARRRRATRIPAIIIAVALSIANPTSALAQTGPGSVSGSVASGDGTPIAGAAVTLEGNGTNRVVHTDATGRFALNGVPPGTYEILVSALGYDRLSGRTIDVRAAEATTVALTLVRSSTSLVTIGRVNTRSGEALSTSSAPAQDLSAQSYAARGYTSVADMLAQDAISTTVIRPSGGNPAAPAVVALRGPDPTETLIDVDGHSVNSGGTGAFDLSLLDPADFSSVQLVYGISPSSLIGPNTIDGAINVRTLEPTAKRHALARLSGGSYGAFGATLAATGTDKRLGYAFSLHRTTTQGEVNDQQIVTKAGDVATVGSAVNGSTGLAKLHYSFGRGDGYVTLTVRDQSQFRDLSAALTTNLGPAVDSTGGNVFNSFAGSSLLAHYAGYGLDVHVPLGAPDSDGIARTTALFRHLTSNADQSVFGPAAGTSPYLYNDRDQIGDDTLEFDHVLTKGTLSVKFGLRTENLDTQQVSAATQEQSVGRRVFDASTGPAPAAGGPQPVSGLGQTQRSAVVRYAFDPTARLYYTLAVYYSDFSSFGTSLDPRAGFVWTPTARSALRTSVGTTFQAPQLSAQYVPPVLPPRDSSGFINIGNPHLKADHATDFDLGFEQIVGGSNSTRASVDLYRTNLRTPSQRFLPSINCVQSSTNPHPPVVACESFPINVGGAVYTGIELRAEHTFAGAAVLRAAYSVNSSYPTSVDPAFQSGTIVPGEQFQSVPLHKGTLSLERDRVSGLSYNVGLAYEDGYNELNRPAFVTLQAGLTYRVGPFELGLHGANLTNVYDDKFTLAGKGVPYGGVDGPIPSNAYSLQGRAFSVVLTRRY
jgi:outer membrane cobalamin receptor